MNCESWILSSTIHDPRFTIHALCEGSIFLGTPVPQGSAFAISLSAADRYESESLDNGKPFAVAQAADVPLAADLFHYMAGWATKIEGNSINISVPYMPGANFHSYTLREPLGVVGQIIPWNFPLLMAAWKLGPALAAGNCVILKPAEQTPLTALRLAGLIAEAGMPDGVVNVVPGWRRRDRRRGPGRPQRRRQGLVAATLRADRRRGKSILGEREVSLSA